MSRNNYEKTLSSEPTASLLDGLLSEWESKDSFSKSVEKKQSRDKFVHIQPMNGNTFLHVKPPTLRKTPFTFILTNENFLQNIDPPKYIAIQSSLHEVITFTLLNKPDIEFKDNKLYSNRAQKYLGWHPNSDMVQVLSLNKTQNQKWIMKEVKSPMNKSPRIKEKDNCEKYRKMKYSTLQQKCKEVKVNKQIRCNMKHVELAQKLCHLHT